MKKNNKGEISEIENDINAQFPPTEVDIDTIKGTLLTTVPNSPVKSIKTDEESQSNPTIHNSDSTNLSPLNLSGPSLEHTCREIPAKTMDEMEA